jgi:hypothetical protein
MTIWLLAALFIIGWHEPERYQIALAMLTSGLYVIHSGVHPDGD